MMINLNEPKETVLLVGAGISIDPPSNLLSGFSFSKNLFHTIAPSSFILQLLLTDVAPSIRFESVMEILCFHIDDQLNILNCLSNCTSYNQNHAIVASLAHQGAIIITTNFDALIERAFLYQFNKEISVILNNDDCKSFIKEESKLFKIHGSLLLYSGSSWIDSRDSVRATLRRIAGIPGLSRTGPMKRNLTTDF